jgi:hypothetical protein
VGSEVSLRFGDIEHVLGLRVREAGVELVEGERLSRGTPLRQSAAIVERTGVR